MARRECQRNCFLTLDFAIECTHKHSKAIRVALSIALIVVMELFLNRSVKNLNLFSLESPIKLAFHRGCEMKVFNGSSFLLFLNAKSWLYKNSSLTDEPV